MERPLVLDFSALWAGPLCGRVLSQLGARVVKIESWTRPDGARSGPAAFHHLQNGGKESVAVDFRETEGRERLRRLISRADIVIDSARPRAWTALGIEPSEAIALNPGLTWVSITGHGRGEPEGSWAGFGDDAAIAAGSSQLVPRQDSRPIFVADALADPLTGLHAAVAAWGSHLAGGGRLVSLALSKVTAYALAFRRAEDPADRAARWNARLAEDGVTARAPLARTPARAARELGADNAAVFELADSTC
jgi:crotonobetainyl-CoA:carnitine CoA-transferase CaiB-like acyl-CoA transferase